MPLLHKKARAVLHSGGQRWKRRRIKRDVIRMIRARYFDPQRVLEAWPKRLSRTTTMELLDLLGDRYTSLSVQDGVGSASQLFGQAPTVKATASVDLPEGIGYIDIDDFWSNETAASVEKALNGLDDAHALVLDLTGNGGGGVESAAKTAAYFIEPGLIARIEAREPSIIQSPQFVNFVYRLTEKRVLMRGRENSHRGQGIAENVPYLGKGRPLVVLVNEKTMSAAELFAFALKERVGATIIGVKTFGKGIIQNTFDIAGGCELKLTTAKWLSPSGQWVGDAGLSCNNGIEPDIVVEAAADSVRVVALETAVEFLAGRL